MCDLFSNICVFLNPIPEWHHPSVNSKVIRVMKSYILKTQCRMSPFLENRNDFKVNLPAPKLKIPIWVHWGVVGDEDRITNGPPRSPYSEPHRDTFISTIIQGIWCSTLKEYLPGETAHIKFWVISALISLHCALVSVRTVPCCKTLEFESPNFKQNKIKCWTTTGIDSDWCVMRLPTSDSGPFEPIKVGMRIWQTDGRNGRRESNGWR